MSKVHKRITIIATLVILLGIAWWRNRPATNPRSAQPPPTPPPLATCTEDDIVAARAALPAYQPGDMAEFVRVEDGQLVAGDDPFVVRGVNYYPARYAWRRFLTETDMQTVAADFALLQSVEFNTLRIFLWNDALFMCPGSGAVPVAENFVRLDAIIRQATAHGLRVIVTLNDLPDLTDYPLYENPPHIQAQTRFIVQRYRDEAAILAWDVRNEGDIDYGTHPSIAGRFDRDTVLDWLGQTAAQVRSLDANHLITAGWLFDSEATVPYVDVVSFHHWTGAGGIQDRLATLQGASDKPVLLEEFGYSTYQMDLVTHAATISDVIDTVTDAHGAGWLIWAAFDFPTDATCAPPHCPSDDNAEHHFGLWYADRTPKPAVSLLLSNPD